MKNWIFMQFYNHRFVFFCMFLGYALSRIILYIKRRRFIKKQDWYIAQQKEERSRKESLKNEKKKTKEK